MTEFEPRRDPRRFSDPPPPSPIWKADKTVLWPESWGLEEKLFSIDYRRRSCTPGQPAKPWNDPTDRFMQAQIASLHEEYGDKIYQMIEESEKYYTDKYNNMKASKGT